MILALVNLYSRLSTCCGPSDHVPQYSKLVWPGLFALVLLIGTVIALLARSRMAIWPFLAKPCDPIDRHRPALPELFQERLAGVFSHSRRDCGDHGNPERMLPP